MTHLLVVKWFAAGPLAALEVSPAVVAGAVLGGLLLAGVALLPVLRKMVDKHHRDSHPALFQRLLSLHNLSRRERQAVTRLVRRENPSPPGRIFVESAWFDRALQGGASADEAELLTALRDRIFSMEDDEQPAEEAAAP